MKFDSARLWVLGFAIEVFCPLARVSMWILGLLETKTSGALLWLGGRSAKVLKICPSSVKANFSESG